MRQTVKLTKIPFITLGALALLAVLSLPRCSSSPKALPESTETSPQTPDVAFEQYEDVSKTELLEARNTYIGNASADGKLIGLVKSYFKISESSTMELQTEEAPYGLTLHFSQKPDNIAMQKASAVLISLIDNCGSVSWDYPVDDAGNKSYYSLTDSLASRYTKGTPIKNYASSEAEFTELLRLVEEIAKPYPARIRAKTVDEAVSAAILEYNVDRYPGDSEVYGEGHMIMDTDKDKEEGTDTLTVYAHTMYGGYRFQNGNFVKDCGTGVIPAVLELAREPDGTYVTTSYQIPLDGGLYLESIQKMFPETLWDACVTPKDDVGDALTRQERVYASEYLQSIGREAAIGDFGDFTYTLPRDLGISVDVSNKLDVNRKMSEGGPIAYAPYWLGSIERLENGVRYVYEHAYDEEKNEIVYSKISFSSGEIVEQEIYDSVSGLKKEIED